MKTNTMYQAAITLNGRTDWVLPGQTIATLLRERGLAPEHVVVEFNGRALTPSETKATPLRYGDVVEVAQIVAGG
jgi:thiamine biosynthesis protein ThiS